MKICAFVFARGGSKGLPKKNITLLAGKPLIAYSIETANNCPSVDKVFVSTDDSEIAAIAKSYDAIVIDRPKELASDTSPEWLSWRHAIDFVEANYKEFKIFVSLPATSPLRSVEDVESSIAKLKAAEADICISITPAARSPYFNMVKLTSKGELELASKQNELVTRRQDAPDVFDITTVVYTANKSFILNKSNIFDGKVVGIVIPKLRAVDIDDIFDFKFAETLLRENKNDIR